jgi:proline iminopeptidase
LAALGNERKVVFYEQLGSGRSDHPHDTTLWTVARYVDELARVRAALGLDSVHIYGHSWGTILAVEYTLTKPAGVRSLILAGPALSAPRYGHDNDSLQVALLPDTIARVLMRSERDPATCATPAYQAAMVAYLRRFFALRLPWSADLDSAVRGNDPTASYTLFGGCGRIGPLQHSDLTDRLHEITIPALIVVGSDDPATPAAARLYQSHWPGSEVQVLDGAGHLPMQDQPERYVALLREFLHRVEGRAN